MLSGSLNALDNGNAISNLKERYGDLDEVTLLNHDDVIIQSKLTLDGRLVDTFLTREKFYWSVTYISPTTRKQKKAAHSILWSNFIKIAYEQGCDKKSRSNEIELFPSRFFSIHFARKAKSNKLKYQHLTFQCSDSGICQSWVDGVTGLLSELSRPSNLLVFINPVGGKKEAEKLYRTKAAPLFDVAKIAVTKVVTERRYHARDYLQSEDISQYDGVIAVGGDGMFSEVMNGLIHYNEESNLHSLIKSRTGKDITLGIIPAGSTDTVVYCTTGGNDATTAALQIILGDELGMDICSVWNEDRFIKYSISMMGYGYFGDIIKESEALRWFGPKRYDFAGVKRFMVNKSYEGEISFRGTKDNDSPSNGTSVDERCKRGCQRCSTFIEEPESPDTSDDWQTISGRFISVFGANISCRCAKSSTGLSPHAHIGDGHVYLVLVRKTTRARHLFHLIKVSEKTTEHFDFNFIDVYRVKEFRFKPITKHGGSPAISKSPTMSTGFRDSQHRDTHAHSEISVWNIDGELVEYPELHFKVHRQLIRIYARGIEDL